MIRLALTRLRAQCVRVNEKIVRRDELEQGFTLIELVIVVAILPLIVGAIAVGILSTFSLETGTSARLVDTAGAQIVASRFVADVQSAARVSLGGTPLCQDSTNPSETQLLGLQWSLGTQTSETSYVLLTVNSGGVRSLSLVRNQCVNNTFQNSDRLANNVNSPTSLTSPTSACLVTGPIAFTGSGQSPACTVFAPTATQPVYVSPGSSQNVSLVTLAINETSSNYDYSLEASPRWTNASTSFGHTYNAPLTILGSSCNVLTINNGGTLSVNVEVNGVLSPGVMAIQSPCPKSVIANSSQGGGSATNSVSAGAVVTADPTKDSFDPSSTGNYNNNPITATNPQEIYGAPTDSLAALLLPLTPSLSGSGSPSVPTCNLRGTEWTFSPGNYSADPNTICPIKKHDTVVFTPGDYWFPSLNFKSGVIAEFQGGTVVLNTPSGWALQTANDSQTTLSATNTLFYVPLGGVNFGNNSVVSVSWSPPTQPPQNPSPSNFYDTDIWDAGSSIVTDGGIVKLSNNSGGSYGGVYAPKGAITTAPNGNLFATFITGSQVTISNNGNVTIVEPSSAPS